MSPPPSNTLLWSIAWRFLRGRENRLLVGTARAALVGITLGVMAMVIAMALMSGYREDLRRKLVRGNAAVIAYPLLGSVLTPADESIKTLEQIPGVTAVRPVVYGQGSLVSDHFTEGVEVVFRGIDDVAGLDGLGDVQLRAALQGGDSLLVDGELGLVLGVDLAKRLGVEDGDALRLMVLGFQGGRPRFRFRQGIAVGTFATGFSEFDQSWAVTDRRELETLLGSELGQDMLEVAVADPEQADDIAQQAKEALGGRYLVTSWRDLNRELFTALEVQQIALFFVLGLIVLVSTFNVASSLVVLVRERMRDIGVLAALGLPPERLRTIFLLYGGGLAAVGSLCGVLLGSLVAWVLTTFELIRFDAKMAAIYFISSVPFRVELVDVLAVVGFTLAVTFLACWVPAKRSASIQPGRALRYE